MVLSRFYVGSYTVLMVLCWFYVVFICFDSDFLRFCMVLYWFFMVLNRFYIRFHLVL